MRWRYISLSHLWAIPAQEPWGGEDEATPTKMCTHQDAPHSESQPPGH